MAGNITLTRPLICPEMFDNNDFSDVHIVGEDDWQEIRAHRVILASGSEEFSRMFAHAADTSFNSIIYFNKFKRIHLYQAIKLIYKGVIDRNDIPEGELQEFLDVCRTLKIKGMPADLMAENGPLPNGPIDSPNDRSPASNGSPGHNDPMETSGPEAKQGPSGSSTKPANNPSSTSTSPTATTGDSISSLKSLSPVKRKLKPEFDAVSLTQAHLPIKSEPSSGSSKMSKLSGSGIKIKAELPDVKPGEGFIKSEIGESSIQSRPMLAPDGDRTKCLVCAKTFTTVGAARTHVKEVHSRKNEKFKCHVCPSEFSVQRYLQSHLQKKHQVR